MWETLTFDNENRSLCTSRKLHFLDWWCILWEIEYKKYPLTKQKLHETLTVTRRNISFLSSRKKRGSSWNSEISFGVLGRKFWKAWCAAVQIYLISSLLSFFFWETSLFFVASASRMLNKASPLVASFSSQSSLTFFPNKTDAWA